MRPEIRRAALRAAAKAALVMSIGCSSGPGSPAPSNTTTTQGPQPAATSCAAHLDALAVVKPEELAADDPLHARMDVYGAFADRAARDSARTQACCEETMIADGSNAAHRWQCCSALASLPAGAEPSACTPWGPPCPPEMT
jgi:hypothetical protein